MFRMKFQEEKCMLDSYPESERSVVVSQLSEDSDREGPGSESRAQAKSTQPRDTSVIKLWIHKISKRISDFMNSLKLCHDSEGNPQMNE